MGFLDNSGDIILDAVLTDTGRFRLAKGDGSFKIAKFALGDDEINYGSYNTGSTSGSAYYDLDILQTPILEAFTNNTSMMKTKLISIPRTDLLYLPILKINTQGNQGGTSPDVQQVSNSASFFVAVDTTTATSFENVNGVIDGTATGHSNSYIRVDQGLDTTDISYAFAIDQQLKETQYRLELDSRLGQIASVGNAASSLNPAFIDDDQVAMYFVSLGTDNYVQNNSNTSDAANVAGQIIKGPRGTYLQFTMQASTELQTSNFLFTKLGSTFNMNKSDGTTVTSINYIDTFVRVSGVTTGYSLDIPVRFIKQ